MTDYSGTLTVGVVPMEPNGIRANVAVFDAQEGGEVLCRIYRDLISERWFVAGIYD